MNKADAEKSPRELAYIRKWFKQLLLEEWKNFEEEKYSSLEEKNELKMALQDEADKMLDDYLTQENKNQVGQERAKDIVGAKYVPNVFRQQKIEGLAFRIRDSIGLYFCPGHAKEEEVEKLVKIYGQGILEYATGRYRQFIQEGALDKINEIMAFATVYLKMRQRLSANSKTLLTEVKIIAEKFSQEMDFQKCVDFYLKLDKRIQDDIVDRRDFEHHNIKLFLNLYLGHLQSPETEDNSGVESANIEKRHKEQIEKSEEDKELLNREIENRNRKILQLKRRIKAPDVSRDSLMQIIDDTRKKNGKHNYTKIGTALGKSKDTAKKWVQEVFGLKSF